MTVWPRGNSQPPSVTPPQKEPAGAIRGAMYGDTGEWARFGTHIIRADPSV